MAEDPKAFCCWGKMMNHWVYFKAKMIGKRLEHVSHNSLSPLNGKMMMNQQVYMTYSNAKNSQKLTAKNWIDG
jgi:hypothetical protein